MPAKREQAKHAAKKREQTKDRRQEAKVREKKEVKAMEKSRAEQQTVRAFEGDKGKVVPKWCEKAVVAKSSKPSMVRTKAPLVCLRDYCKSKNWVMEVVPTKPGENGFKHQVTISSNNKLLPSLNTCLDMDDDERTPDRTPSKFRYTFRNNGKGHSTQDFSQQMSCLYALLRLDYPYVDTIDPKYREQRRKIIERGNDEVPELNIEGLEYGPLVDAKLVTSSRAIYCVRYGVMGTYTSPVDDVPVEFVKYELGAWVLTCLKEGDNFPVSVWVTPRAERSSLPPPSNTSRQRGVVSTWKDSFGFITTAGCCDIYFNVSSSRFPPGPKQNLSSFFAPDQVVEYTTVYSGDRVTARDVVVLQ